MKRFKTLIALFLALSVASSFMTACGKANDAELEASITSTAEVLETTTSEKTPSTNEDDNIDESTNPADEETSNEPIVMYGARELSYYDGEGFRSSAAGVIALNEAYEVLEETATSYYISIDGSIYRVAKIALTSEVPDSISEDDEDADEQTEPTNETSSTPTPVASGNTEPTTTTNPATRPTETTARPTETTTRVPTTNPTSRPTETTTVPAPETRRAYADGVMSITVFDEDASSCQMSVPVIVWCTATWYPDLNEWGYSTWQFYSLSNGGTSISDYVEGEYPNFSQWTGGGISSVSNYRFNP